MGGNTGFILGAGASYELGLPLVDELTIEFKSSLLKVWNTPYYKVSKEIDTILLPLFKNKDLNYEDIIGKIEVEIKRNKNSNLYQEWHGVLARFVEVIFVLLLERHTKNFTYIKKRLKFLHPIKNYCKDEPLWIFSLNHDVIIEMFANHSQVPLKNGFFDYVNIGEIQFEQLSRENMKKNQFNFFYNEPGINLIKIHGALDIFVQGDDKEYLKVKGKKGELNSIIENINFLQNNDPSVKAGVKCTNEITYYDTDQFLQFLRGTIISGKHKYSSNLSHNMDDWFFKIFKGHINYCTELYCIGLSFQDKHIITVLYDWLSSSEDRKIIIVNPYIDNIPNEFSHLSDQVELINMGFLEFLNQKEKKNILKIKLNQKMRNYSRKRFLST